MAPLDGVIRLEARYEAYGRPASMVFRFRRYDLGPPTFADCLSAAQQYGLWENSGAGFGYSLLRSSDSFFTAANVWSEDPRSPAAFIDKPFSRSGQLPPLSGFLIPTALAPVIKWQVVPFAQFHGRTYCVGVGAADVDLEDDRMRINGVIAADLVAQFRRLIPPGPPSSQFGMVTIARGRPWTTPPGPLVLEVVNCDMPTRTMGTQDRRAHHGSG